MFSSMRHRASKLPLNSGLCDLEQVSHFPSWNLSFFICTTGMIKLALPVQRTAVRILSTGMNVLSEFGSGVHREGGKSKVFHTKRQESLSTQVSEWWRQPNSPSSGLVQALILSPRTTLFSEILWPELGQVSSHSSFKEGTC